MIRGRKPHPTTIKIAKGERPDRINRAEPPTVPVEHAEPPSQLNDEARAEWFRMIPILTRMKVLSESDLAALALYCEAHARHSAAARDLSKRGMVTMTADGPRINPAVGIAERASNQALRFLVEFGLTPSSRSRLKTTTPAEQDTFASFQAKRRKNG
jgi:P27 family predicted phage terminase small subunit